MLSRQGSLVRVTTRDGVHLDGMYQAPKIETTSAQSTTGVTGLAIDAFVCVHGTGSNFYGSTLFDGLGEYLLARGYGILRVNTRGHDLMSTASTTQGGRRQGAAYERVDDCRHDLAAWVDWLRQQGLARVGLIGHSLGAVKCLYASAAGDVTCAGVVGLSPPRLSHAWFLGSERKAEFLDTYHRARSLVEAGEPEALLEVRLPLPFVITAAGYVEKYGPDERYNYLRFLRRVPASVLVTLGEVEVNNNIAFQGAPEAIQQTLVTTATTAPTTTASDTNVRVEVISGADHFYSGVRESLFTCVGNWLSGSL